jgi:hypothetical protein
MRESELGLIVSFLAIAMNLAGQLGSYRLLGFGYMRSVFAGFALGGLTLGLGEFARFMGADIAASRLLVLLAGDGAIYVCLGYLFFNFINSGESSIRVRILWELQHAAAPLDEPGLLAIYNDDLILSTRLARLVRSGKVIEHDGRYILHSSILVLMARTMRALKLLIVRRESEFD